MRTVLTSYNGTFSKSRDTLFSGVGPTTTAMSFLRRPSVMLTGRRHICIKNAANPFSAAWQDYFAQRIAKQPVAV
jgi:hypothetical protein